MGGGKFMGWLNANPAIMQGVKGAVGGALNSLKPQEEISYKGASAPVESEPVASKPKIEGSMMYLAIGAIVLFMLMKKK